MELKYKDNCAMIIIVIPKKVALTKFVGNGFGNCQQACETSIGLAIASDMMMDLNIIDSAKYGAFVQCFPNFAKLLSCSTEFV